MSYQRWREEFFGNAGRNGIGIDDARALLRTASTIQRLNEIVCSIERTERQAARDERDMELAEKRANAITARLGPGWIIEHNGDPRGWPFSLTSPTGTRIGVPGRGLPARCFA